MSLLRTNLLKCIQIAKPTSYAFHTTCINTINLQWREKRGLSKNPTKFGPLTDLPDYTFMDGRPTPLGGRQIHRVMKQREYAQKIVTGIAEVDFAKERLKTLKNDKAVERKAIIDNKLKPKGHILLKK